MKLARTLFLILIVGVPILHAQTPTRLSKEAPSFRKPGLPKPVQTKPLLAQAPLLLAAPTLATSSASITDVTCPEVTASRCGYVPVPLDRRYPNGTHLQIYFEVYPHTAAGAAVSAIMVNLGGPGPGTTQSRDYFQFLFGPNLDVHDLLLVDDRGTGLSGAIDCPELQHGTAPFIQSEIDCVAQLGLAASRYANGDIAQDMDAVRVALGYNLIDYLGASWGGVDATAYAVRYPEHTRSLVLDAPLSTPGLPELVRLHDRVHSDPRMVRLVCSRSVLCSQDQPDPDETFEELIEMIREHPIEGDTFDASGNPMHIRIDEDALLNFVVTYPQGEYINTGEILAAAGALKHGDKTPLLRLGAEGFFTLVGDSGDPTGNSAGAYFAIGCGDTVEPFDWSAPVFARIDQYNDAVGAASPGYFAPFTPWAANDFLFSGNGRECFWWQRPTPPSPTVPPHASFPNTPTLVLDGDIDNRVPYEETNEVAELFPNSTNVIIPEAGHETIGWSQCALNLANQFIETLQAGDTSCANSPAAIFPAVGRFPLVVEDARPANPDSSGTNQIGIAERKTVSVSVATAIDALQRSLISFGSGSGVGLRSGTFTTGINGLVWTITLTNCAFATDVIVNGTFVWGSDNSIIGDLSVSGPGTAGGILHITGYFDIPGPVGNFHLTGTLGGKQVAVLVPEA
jgi:pimeloyl-ACP methyl ester carboxylesterase